MEEEIAVSDRIFRSSAVNDVLFFFWWLFGWTASMPPLWWIVHTILDMNRGRVG